MSDVLSQAVHFIKNAEGFQAKAYLCPAGKWTIGYGTTFINGKPVSPRMTITEVEAERLLSLRVSGDLASIKKLIKVPLSDGQMTALASFCYNFNQQVLAGSTLRRRLNAGDYAGAANELVRKDPKTGNYKGWIYIENPKTHVMEVSEGLINRRTREKALFV